ncbi:hypothetical protein BR93DRAFT_465206 [Coniochaeta sp. PMI_546]|nr:hypothetical protein BR93DRAFT_465206 [Coniochaeta sp. PMI_546]
MTRGAQLVVLYRMQQDSCWWSPRRSGSLLVCWSCRSVVLGGRGGIQGRPAGLLRQLKRPKHPCFKHALLLPHKDVQGRDTVSPFPSKPPGGSCGQPLLPAWP